MQQPGTILRDTFKILRVLGQGGMGGVYEACYLNRSVSVAIKEMLLHFNDPEQQEAAARVFMSEARLLYSLSHVRLPRMYDFFESEGRWYLVMDYVPGTTLDHEVQTRGPLPEAEVRHLLAELVDVLAYMHGQRKPVIFRDLKPANVMLTQDGHIKLIDFGIAKLFHANHTRTDSMIASSGTLGFAAPEQYGCGTDERSDIYSLGATCYCLLTGIVPPASPSLACEAEVLTPLRVLRPDLTPGCVALVEHMMQLPPACRPARMQQVAVALARLTPLHTPGGPPGLPDVPVSESDDTFIDPAVVAAARTPHTAPPATRPGLTAVPCRNNTLLAIGPRRLGAAWHQAAAACGRSLVFRATLHDALDYLEQATPDAMLLLLPAAAELEKLTPLADWAREMKIPWFAVVDRPDLAIRILLARQGCELTLEGSLPIPVALARIRSCVEWRARPAPRVLAVDDDDIALAAMEMIFADSDIGFHALSDPTRFWETLEEVQPDLVLLDLEMPLVSGLDLCRTIRTDDAHRRLPVIVLTAANDADTIAAVYEAGADDYASKPILGEELVTRVQNRMARIWAVSDTRGESNTSALVPDLLNVC